MEEFLHNSKQILESNDFTAVHIILGNEACDLDSAVSAVVYAFFLNKIHDGEFFLPVLDVPSSDFQLKTETVFAFGEHGITRELLTFCNQVKLAEWTTEKDVKITLVDHNVLKESYKGYEPLVVEVIDHHVLEREPSDSCEVTVEMVGSCTTLIAEKIFANTEFEMTDEVAELLYGTILVDTVCLAESSGRVTPKDSAMIDKIEAKLPQRDRKTTFNAIIAAKNDISALSTNDLLRKDLKILKTDELTIAFCSLPCHINDFLARENVDADLMTFEEKQEASAVILMCLIVDEKEEAQRQIAVHSRDAPLVQKIVTFLCLQTEFALSSLAPHSAPPLAPSSSSSHTYSSLSSLQTFLTCPKISRKKVLPSVKKFFREQYCQ
ncbi:hypothetical protein CAPTEDRAFT_167402 [Capitella teleta]|uniref:DHHA2 domain-containing protein n=1 Tax=Capitella teleta TaxID=283909 RepID=R7UVU7_CAPTE|nr:hypothetical protein CAPTEDRAFT_167402 [Capitella teleta]|eukprot:ELU10738.1 hypothetical protein CAPTEDRAFT_167402 [Capitella teleta]